VWASRCLGAVDAVHWTGRRRCRRRRGRGSSVSENETRLITGGGSASVQPDVARYTLHPAVSDCKFQRQLWNVEIVLVDA